MQLKISRVLHAGYIFEHQKTKIIFDPIFENPFSQNCYAFPSVKFDLEAIKELEFSAVFISHFHDDHCSLESLIYINRKTPIYIYCIFDELILMIKELGFVSVYSLKINCSVSVGSFEVIPRKALDEYVDSLFHIKVDNLNILNVVDSWIDTSTLNQLAQENSWDMILWPFQTMREIEVLTPARTQDTPIEIPPEWIEQIKTLRPKYIVPSSCQFIQENWSWYNSAFFPISYKDFKEKIELAMPQIKVIRLNPSAAVYLDQETLTFAPTLKWIMPLGNQDADYSFEPNLIPPSTAEISKNFPALSLDETKRVYNYCQNEIIKKHIEIGPSEDDFFRKKRFWRLSIFDHNGEASIFYYVLNGSEMKLIKYQDEPLSWCTEIPLFKLYAALENGEALTSLYMRINEMQFDENTERDLGAVDILDDPLIRCLFKFEFGAYQKAQLKRLGFKKNSI